MSREAGRDPWWVDELLIMNDERDGWQTKERANRGAGSLSSNVAGLQASRLDQAQLASGVCSAKPMGGVAEDGIHVEVGKGEDARSVEEVECRKQGDEDA